MKHKEDKIKIYFIAIVLAVCAAGIGFYAFKSNNDTTKKQAVNADKKQNYINLKNVKDKISLGNVKDIKDVTGVCSIYDDNSYIFNDGQSLSIKDKKGNNVEKIISVKEGCVSFEGRYKDNIVFSVLGLKMENNQQYEIKTIYIYNRNTKKTDKISESTINKDYGAYKFRISDCIKVHDNNVFYAADCTDNDTAYELYDYDIDTKKKKKIYSAASDKFQLNYFDADIKAGYIVCEVYNGTTENENYLKLIDINKNKTRILAKSENMFNLSLNYPKVIFNLNDKVHIYDIKKSADDKCIQCNFDISSIDVYNDKLFIKLSDIYCYSLNEKKVYRVDYPADYNEEKSGISIMNGKLCWFGQDVVHYLNIDK